MAKKKFTKLLSIENIMSVVRGDFKKISSKNPRAGFSIENVLNCAFAMFKLKDSSLLAFDQRRFDDHARKNLEDVFKIKEIPSDTQMRSILDLLSPEVFRPCFKRLFALAQKSKYLDRFNFLGHKKLIAIDGTQFFVSKKLFSRACLVRNHQNGSQSYALQALCAVVVHPSQQAVIPLMPEPIVNQDGMDKNDCEINAAKRFVTQFRTDHPKLDSVIVADSLFSTSPFIEACNESKVGYIFVADEGNHLNLFKNIEEFRKQGLIESKIIKQKDGSIKYLEFCKNVQLNNQDHSPFVNFVMMKITKEVPIKPINEAIKLAKNLVKSARELLKAAKERVKVKKELLKAAKEEAKEEAKDKKEKGIVEEKNEHTKAIQELATAKNTLIKATKELLGIKESNAAEKQPVITEEKTVYYNVWITDQDVTEYDVEEIADAGRCRWNIENDCFNNLKNQGYHFGHNFGLGQAYLAIIFLMSMMLAFLSDQLQQLGSQTFQDAYKVQGTRKSLWEKMRSIFQTYTVDSLEKIFQAIAYGYQHETLIIMNATSPPV